MAIDAPPPDPARVRLETLLECAERRLSRAEQRLLRAQQEHAEAAGALAEARAELAGWIKDNPDPQLPLI